MMEPGNTETLLDSFAATDVVLRHWLAAGAPQPEEMDAPLELLLSRYRALRG